MKSLILAILFISTSSAFAQSKAGKKVAPQQQRQNNSQGVTQADIDQQRQQMQSDREEFEAMIEKQFKQSNDLIKQFFDEGEMDKFHKSFRKMFRDFQNMQDMDDSMFGTPGTRKLFQHLRGAGGSMFDKEWVDGPEKDQVSLILRIQQVGSQPLNIKVEKGMLKIDGTVRQIKKKNGQTVSNTVSTVNIQQSLGRDDIIPDPVNMLQDNEGNLRIVFKRRDGAPKQIQKVRPQNTNPKKIRRPRPNRRRQIPHDKDSTSI
jgi:hypothetical protein